MLLYGLFFWVLRLKIKVGLLLLECRILWNECDYCMSLYVLFFLGFKTENQTWFVITGMQNFLELIWLLHVIICAVSSGF